jgi:hypothetical protein
MVAAAIQLAFASGLRFQAIGVAVVWTPTALSLTALISPSSFEISAAILTWTACLLLVHAAATPAWLSRSMT